MRGGDDRSTGSNSRVPDAGEIDAAIFDARVMIDARRQDWTDLLQELIRIPSCFEAEHAIVRRVCEYVTGLGLVPDLLPMDETLLRGYAHAAKPISPVADRNNVVVRLRGRGAGRSLILATSTPKRMSSSAAVPWTTRPASPFVLV